MWCIILESLCAEAIAKTYPDGFYYYISISYRRGEGALVTND